VRILDVPSCHEGSCDCDRVFEDYHGQYPAICDVRKLLKALEPYRPQYARRQIVLVFALCDKPWLTSSNQSVVEPNGRFSSLNYELPTQMVQSNWFGRIFYEAKRDRLPGLYIAVREPTAPCTGARIRTVSWLSCSVLPEPRTTL